MVREGQLHRAVAADPQHVADIVVTLSWTPRHPVEVLQYLQLCTDLAVHVTTGAHCARIITDHGTATGEVVAADTATSSARRAELTDTAGAEGVGAAFAMLCSQSQDTNTELHDVATTFLTRSTTPHQPGPSALTRVGRRRPPAPGPGGGASRPGAQPWRGAPASAD